MSRRCVALLTIAGYSIAAWPVLAATESSYVYCSNGITCVRAPCPSGDVLDLITGTVIKGVAIDATRLPPLDRAAVDFPDKLNAGKIVVRGSIQHKGDESNLPWLVAVGVERTAKQSERKHCSAR